MDYKMKKTYGTSKIIKHPQGFEYKVKFLSPEKTLGYSEMIFARYPNYYGKGKHKYLRID